MVKILILDDLMDEVTEFFTAELPSDSTTIYIVDTGTVVYTFHQSEYFVYESNSYVTLNLSSSKRIPSEFQVDVDIVYGIGNASGEC